MTDGHVLLVGTGLEQFRRYLLEGIVRRHRVVLLNPTPVTWQRALVADHAEVDFTDQAAVFRAAKELAARNEINGVLTWDESLLEHSARIAEQLGVPGLPVSAALACRDKARQRELFARHGVPSARFRTVDTVGEALDAAVELGYPLVVKPRALAGSIGVRLVRDDGELREAVERAGSAHYPGFGGTGGLLLEEYLVGTEISVDSWVLDGTVTPFVMAKKIVGLAPHFEETGHLVGGALGLATAEKAQKVVAAANLALGVDHAVTHTEVMLTADGPRLIEVNGRLGGDLIPYLGELAGGIEAGAIAADVAVHRRPESLARHARLAAVQFIYPDREMRLDGVRMAPELEEAPWIERWGVLFPPGSELLLPPKAYLTRAAYVVCTADDESGLAARMAEIRAGVVPFGPALV